MNVSKLFSMFLSYMPFANSKKKSENETKPKDF